MRKLHTAWAGMVGLALLMGAMTGNALPTATQSATGKSAANQLFMPLVENLANWPNPFGVEVEIGANVKPDSPVLARARELGVGSIRLHRRLSWRLAQPNLDDTINFSQFAEFEAELRGLASANITPMVTIWDSPLWATVQPKNCSAIRQDRLSHFAAFLSAVVNRYKAPEFNVHVWEIGNEVDIDPRAVPAESFYGCWGNADDKTFYGGKQYGEAIKVAGAAIRAADPSAKIVIGGLITHQWEGSPQFSYTDQFLRGVLSVGAGPYFDAIGFHGHFTYYNQVLDYASAPYGGWVNADPAKNGPIKGKISVLKSALNAYGQNKPLWLNEVSMGCPIKDFDGSTLAWCNPSPQPGFYVAMADHIPRMMVRYLHAGVERFVWYSLAGAGWRFSDLLGSDNQTATLGFTAYKNLITQLNGVNLSPTQVNYANGVEAYRFNRVGNFVEVIFATDNSSKTITIPQAQFVRAIDRDGNVISPQFVNGNTQISVGFSPIYIHRR